MPQKQSPALGYEGRGGEVSRKEDPRCSVGAAFLEDAIQGPQNYRKESPVLQEAGRELAHGSGLHTQKVLGREGCTGKLSVGVSSLPLYTQPPGPEVSGEHAMHG